MYECTYVHMYMHKFYYRTYLCMRTETCKYVCMYVRMYVRKDRLKVCLTMFVYGIGNGTVLYVSVIKI